MRDEEFNKLNIFTRRAFILGGGKISLLILILARMYYLQVLKVDKYTTLSDKNRIKILLVSPPRGNILDRHNIALAVNQNYYRVLLEKEWTSNTKEVLHRLINLLGLSEIQREYILKRYNAYNDKAPFLVYEYLSWQNVAIIETNSMDLPGVSVDVGQIRYYPFQHICAHIVGYVGQISKNEKSNKDLVGVYQSDFKIGKTGIEKFVDSKVRGSFGIRRIEVNAYGLKIRELTKEDSKQGTDVNLTIDIKLQDFVNSKLDSRGAAAVILNIKTGEILAMSSTPGFNPNQLTQKMTNKEWQDLLNMPGYPMTNKAISSYPPGSIFKLVTFLAALEDGIDTNQIVHCPGYYMLGNRKLHCWKGNGHGHINMHNAIMQSCNTYVCTLAKKLGIDKIIKVAHKLGLGEQTGIELPSESNGFIPTRKWKKARFKKSWQVGDTLNCSIGQGYIMTSPLQLATMIARIASKGKKIIPTILKEDQQNDEFGIIDFNPKNLEFLKSAMEAVVNVPGGTSYASKILDKRYAMAGKTGTSQVLSKKSPKQDFSKANIPWENRNHALFLGYAPIYDPQFACAVLIEHGGSGSKVAAPIARDILTEVQKIYDEYNS